MLATKEHTFNIENFLTNARGGKTKSSNVLKLLLVFSAAIFLQCFTLLLSKDFILSNNVSSTTFLFIAFSFTCIVSVIQQRSWKYLSYLNAKRIPIILFQSILYSFSFLCLIHGITTNGVLQYYSVINTIQILNVLFTLRNFCSNNWSSNKRQAIQLLLSIICFAIGIYVLCNNNLMEIIGLISLMAYHFIAYLREQHYESTQRHHKSFARIQPLALLLAAFIVLMLSIFSHLSLNLSSISVPHHDHSYDLQEQFANDERAFMHHSANHDIDVSAKITHRLRLLLSDDNIIYNQKMKELEQLAEDLDDGQNENLINDHNNELNDNKDTINNSIYSVSHFIWSMIIYILFVLFFILLNNRLSYLQKRIYQLVFSNKRFNNILNNASHSHSHNKPMADILKLSTSHDLKGSKSGNNDLKVEFQNDDKDRNDKNSADVRKQRWWRFIVLYHFVSIQCIGVLSHFIICILYPLKQSNRYIAFGSLSIFIGNECATRVFIALQHSLEPQWLNNILHPQHRHHRHAHSHKHSVSNAASSSFIIRIFAHIPYFIQHIRDTRTSRRLFIFLSLNFLFMFIEFFYGYWSNSLGLISDACHMLFDCIALVIGLLASYLGSSHSLLSHTKQSIHKYSFGYGKIKVMSGFINAIFLVYIGLSVLIESFERIIHPPHIHSDQLLIVSVLGLLVNLVGLFFFHDAHMHSHSQSHSCAHDHHHHHHDHDHDHNIHGIFLHILADTLGSVGVIISSLLIYFFDLTIFDALCSVFIALLIFVTVKPLIESTSKILLQETPPRVLASLVNDLSNVLSSVSGIIGYREAHFWESEPGKLIGSIHIQVDEKCEQQQLLAQLNDILKLRFGFQSEKDLTIQIEKQSYLDKCDPVHHSVYSQIVPIKAIATKAANKHQHQHHKHHHHHHNHHHHDESQPCNHSHSTNSTSSQPTKRT